MLSNWDFDILRPLSYIYRIKSDFEFEQKKKTKKKTYLLFKEKIEVLSDFSHGWGLSNGFGEAINCQVQSTDRRCSVRQPSVVIPQCWHIFHVLFTYPFPLLKNVKSPNLQFQWQKPRWNVEMSTTKKTSAMVYFYSCICLNVACVVDHTYCIVGRLVSVGVITVVSTSTRWISVQKHIG